jgi:serine/threonine-protein kinase RsbW
MTSTGMRPGDSVCLALPARSEFVGVARSLAANVASRLDLDLDQVEDLRLAVSEACAVVLPDADPSSELVLELVVGDDSLEVELSGATTASEAPSADSFAWTVLRALAEDAAGEIRDGRLVIQLRFSAPTAVGAAPDEPSAGTERL